MRTSRTNGLPRPFQTQKKFQVCSSKMHPLHNRWTNAALWKPKRKRFSTRWRRWNPPESQPCSNFGGLDGEAAFNIIQSWSIFDQNLKLKTALTEFLVAVVESACVDPWGKWLCWLYVPVNPCWVKSQIHRRILTSATAWKAWQGRHFICFWATL